MTKKLNLMIGEMVFHIKHGVCEVMPCTAEDFPGTWKFKHWPTGTTIVVAENKLSQSIRELVSREIIIIAFTELVKQQKSIGSTPSGIRKVHDKLYSGNPIKVASVLRDSYSEEELSSTKARYHIIAIGLFVPEAALVLKEKEEIISSRIRARLSSVRYPHLKSLV